jgi:hypothetical protein
VPQPHNSDMDETATALDRKRFIQPYRRLSVDSALTVFLAVRFGTGEGRQSAPVLIFSAPS